MSVTPRTTLIAPTLDATDLAAYTTASITPTANQLVLVAVAARRAAGSAAPTVAGNSLTYVQVASVAIGAARRVTVFRALGASPTSGALTIDFGGVTQVDCAWAAAEFGNVDTSGTNGSGAVVQSPTNTGSTDTPTVTLAAFGSAGNGTYAAAALDGTSTHTAGAGGFALMGAVLSNANLSLAVESRGDSDTSADFTPGAARNWGIVGVEVKAITATGYDFGQEPSNADAGAVISPAVTVRAEDASGNLDTSYTGNITVALTTAGGATLGGTLTQAAVAGVATFNDLEVDLAGTYTLTATGNLTSTESASFTIAAVAGVATRSIMYARRRGR